MSYAQGTQHYNFPQIVASDRPVFADANEAFRTIDTKLYGLEGDASTVDGRLDTIEARLPEMDTATQAAQNTADGAKAEADTNAEHITALEVLTGRHTTQIANKLDSVAIAEQYDPNAGTYAVGDIVVYSGQRYRCVTAVAVAEPFDADKWIGEDVETVINQIKSDKADISDITTTNIIDDSTFKADKCASIVTLHFFNTSIAPTGDVITPLIGSSNLPNKQVAFPFADTTSGAILIMLIGENGSIYIENLNGTPYTSNVTAIGAVTYVI